jgi:hypothetical protein
MFWTEIDHGFLGLIVLLMLIFFLVAFSFLVAASAAGVDIKLAVVIVDALVLLGSKLLAPRFLQYLESGCAGDESSEPVHQSTKRKVTRIKSQTK